MKKTILFLTALFLAMTSFAQHISKYYAFTDTNVGSYQHLSNDGSTTHIIDYDSDGGEQTILIGFDFIFAGTTYSELTVGVNGALTFTGDDVFGGNLLEGTDTNVTDIIGVVWDDLNRSDWGNDLIHYKLTGTTPNQKLAIEWRVSWWNDSQAVTFQVALYESSNNIEMTFSAVENPWTDAPVIGASIGINAGTSGDNYMSITPGSSASMSTTIPNNEITHTEYNDNAANHKYLFEYGPDNDACNDAIVINSFPYSNTQDMEGTTNNDGFITPSGCGSGMNDGVWYTFTAPVSGTVLIDASTVFDAEIGVYSGSCDSFTCVGNRDGEGSNATESLSVNVVEDTQYWINVGYYSNSSDSNEEGTLSLALEYDAPSNDLCADAIDISCGDEITGTNIGATSATITGCGIQNENLGVWYHFAPTNGGGVTAIWTTADFDTKFTVFSGECGSFSCIANDDDTNGNQPYIEIETLPATDYYIYVSGFGTYTGTFDLNIACTTPANDEATGAILMDVNVAGDGCNSLTTAWNSNGVTSSEAINDIPACANYNGGDSWYKFVAPDLGGVRLLKPNSGDWQVMGYALYDSTSGDNSDIITCSSIGTTETESNPITGLTPGNTYWLRVWEYNNNDFGSVGICLEELAYTYVPDHNFEQYLETHNADGDTVALGATDSMGNGRSSDHYVLTSRIENVLVLNLVSRNIYDLTGIEDFTALYNFNCNSNYINDDLDLSNNTNLTYLSCKFCSLTSIDVSTCTSLVSISCANNNLSALDVSANTALQSLFCYGNELTELDLSTNTLLNTLLCQNNALTALDVRNIPVSQIETSEFYATGNTNLTCIYTDDVAVAQTNWTNIDATTTFVEDEAACTSLGYNDLVSLGFELYPNPTTDVLYLSALESINKISIYNMLGQEVKINTPLVTNLTLDVSDLSTGTYFIKAQVGNHEGTFKFIKQ